MLGFNFSLDFSHPQLTDFSFLSVYVTALAYTHASNPLLPTLHFYHIHFLLHFTTQLRKKKKDNTAGEKDTIYRYNCSVTITTQISLFEMCAFYPILHFSGLFRSRALCKKKKVDVICATHILYYIGI